MESSNNTLKVIPLGGLGEIGQNMMVIEYAKDILIVDAGLRFHEGDIPGIKIGIPDITYLLENKNRIKGILITHGHEDHIGALPYIITKLNAPIFSSKFTIALISSKLKDAGISGGSELNIVSPSEQFNLGRFKIDFFRVCHSIPDSMGIYLETPDGSIMMTGDFKIDHTPVDGLGLDFQKISSIASKEITLLCSDSTYAEIEGYTPSESTIKNTINTIVGQASSRIFFVTFASSISRIQQIIDAGLLFNRKISFLGRSITNNVNLAMKLGYLNVPADSILPLHKNSTRHDKAIIIATGSQGEPMSAIVRIASQQHPKISVIPGDTVVFSSSPIPGNEVLVSKSIDNLSRQGANVIHNGIASVHVHGHARGEELKMMISLVKPKFFMPIHGEYRHLKAHGNLAKEMGIPSENIFVTGDGTVIELDKNSAKITGNVPAGTLFLDGPFKRPADSTVFRDRRQLSTQGVIALSVSLDHHSKKITIEPTSKSLGLFDVKEEKEWLEKACKMVQTTLEDEPQHTLDLIDAESRVQSLFENLVFSETKKHPRIIVHAKYRNNNQNN